MIDIHAVIEYYLDEDIEKIQKFAKWAFGKHFKIIISHGPEVVKIWNQRHGDKLLIDNNNSVHEDIQLMIELWKNQNEN
jgi:hypothetical protein